MLYTFIQLKNVRLAAFIALVIIAVAACKQNPSGNTGAAESIHANLTNLSGRWIAMDFCSRANQYGSVLSAMNNGHVPYAFAFAFDAGKGDSVLCYNGVEDAYALPIKINVDTIEVIGAVQGKSIFFVYDPTSKEMTLFNTTSGQADTDRFIKSKFGGRNGYIDFLGALNTNVLSGTFKSTKKGGPENIVFEPTGMVKNLPGFDQYALCTAGDCFVTGDKIDVIRFRNSKTPDTETMMGYRYSRMNDTLTIYNLINSKPEEKGAYTIGNVVHQLSRKQQ